MTSQIVSSIIDETYPVAGIDNNSQGFRENFSAIKEGLATAASEITNLQTGSASLTQDNDFGGHLVANAVYNKFYGVAYNQGSTHLALQSISLNNGPYQLITFGDVSTTTIVLQDWPSINKYAKIQLHLFSNQNGTKTVQFGTVNAGVIKTEVGFPNPFLLPADGHSKLVEAWTTNGGNTVYLRLVGTF